MPVKAKQRQKVGDTIWLLKTLLVSGGGHWKRLGHQMMHGMVIWKPGISETAKASKGIAPCNTTRGAYYSAPYEPPVARVNVLSHVGLWPRAIKLNPS